MPRAGLTFPLMLLLAVPVLANRKQPADNPPAKTGVVAQIRQKDPGFASRYPSLARTDLSTLGVVGDGLELNDGATTAGSMVFTSVAGKFLPRDVGKSIFIQGAGISGIGGWLNTTIASYQSPTTVTLNAPALYTITNALFDYGTDNTAVINALTGASDPNNPDVLHSPQPGRQLYLPSGTYLLSGTIYIRKGDVLEGDGFTATELMNFDTNPNNPILKIGANAVSGLDTGGLDVAVLGVYFGKAEGEATAIDTMGNSGWDVRDCWFQVAVGILATGTDGIISGNTFDSSTAHGIIVRGDGQNWNITNSILISNNRFYDERYAGIELDGAVNINIVNNYFDYSQGMSIYSASQAASYRIIIQANQFRASLDPNYSLPHQKHIYWGSPLLNSIISTNVFQDSHDCDVCLDNAGISNLQITNNTSQDAQGNFITVTNAGPGVVVSNNRVINPGYYAGDFDVAVDLENNFCSHPFSVGRLPENDVDRACFRFVPGVSGITAKGNTTDSDAVAAVSLHAGSFLDLLSGNQSNWSLGGIYIGPGTGRVSSTEETIYNDGGAGTVFTLMSDASSGNVNFGGTLTAGSSQVQLIDGSGHLLASALTGLYLGTLTVTDPYQPVALPPVQPAPKHCWASSINNKGFAPGPLPYMELQGGIVILHALAPAGAQFDVFCVFN
jgi:hypothetical protein